MMVFHHVGLVVQDITTAQRIQDEAAVGAGWHRSWVPDLSWERVEAFGCQCAFSVVCPELEFVVPDADSRLAKYLGGVTVLHHVAFRVRSLADLPGPWLFPAPQKGARGLIVNFRPPQDGLLVELVEVP